MVVVAVAVLDPVAGLEDLVAGVQVVMVVLLEYLVLQIPAVAGVLVVIMPLVEIPPEVMVALV